MWIRVATLIVCLTLLAPGVAVADDSSPDTTTALCAPNCYVGVDGSLRDSALAYRRLVARGTPHYLRNWLEMAAMIGGGAAWYWIDEKRQVADWDFPTIKQRLTLEAWRFDNNPFDINFFWHTFNGMSFHVFSRSNELSLIASAGVGLVTSLAWEIGIEFREKISVNDVITTTGAGVAVGEFLHWFGRYLNSGGEDNPIATVLRWTAGLPRSMHNNLDGRLEHQGERDRLGFSADIWHRFDLGYGFAFADISRDGVAVSNDAHLHVTRLDARLAALPGYLRPGTLKRFFADGNITSLDLTATFSGDGVGVDFIADTMLLGYHIQNIPMPEQDGVGTALTLGADIAYRYRKETFFGWRERLGLMHLPGLAVDAHVLTQRFRLRAAGRAHFDFAGVNALSYPAWKAANPDAVEKTILRKHGYYYAWGVSASGALEVSGPSFDAGASIFYGRYNSQEGLDRTQETVEVDVPADDSVLEYSGWLRIGPFLRDWYVGAELSRRDRKGNVGGVRGSAVLDRIMVQLITRM